MSTISRSPSPGRLSGPTSSSGSWTPAAYAQFGLTNWSHELYPYAPRTYEVVRLLEDVVVSGTEQLAKPDPAIFQLTAERAGLPPEQLAFVDDNPANVAGARDVGLRAFLFTGADTLRRDLRGLGLPV